MGRTGARAPGQLGRVLAVVVLLTLASTVGTIVVVRSALPVGRASDALASSSGAIPLAQAEASLAQGAGPALGSALLCHSTGAGSVGCESAAASSAASSTGGYFWSNLTTLVGTAPSGRIASMTWDGSDGYVLLFGGATGAGLAKPLDDTWTYANGTWTNITATTTGAPPAGIALEGLAWDPSSAEVVLFGGYSVVQSENLNYTWVYHARTWTNLTSALRTAPSAREVPAMTTDTTDGQVVLFGGLATPGFLTDTWTFHDGVWTNITSTQPIRLPAIEYPVISDYPGHGALLLGASNISGRWVTLTYILSMDAWTNITSTLPVSPPPPGLGYATYLPSLSGVLEVTGVILSPALNVIYLPVAWLFTGTAWTNVTDFIGTTVNAYTPLAAAAAYVPTDQSIITFGGEVTTGVYGTYTWALSAPPSVTAYESVNGISGVADVGQPVIFYGAVSGGLEPNKITWEIGNGGVFSNLTQSYVWATGYAGFWGNVFRVTDLAGVTSTVTVSLTVNPAPTVTIGATNGTAGSPVGLAAVVTWGTGPYSYSWTLGDGATSVTDFVNHTYAHAGAYTVNVTVRDIVGVFAKDSVVVTVAAAPSAPSLNLTSGTGLGLLLGIVVLGILAVVFLVLWVRRPKPPMGSPAPYGGAGTPPSSGTPPPPPGAS
jgi:PKD domain